MKKILASQHFIFLANICKRALSHCLLLICADMTSSLLRLARLTQPDFKALARSRGRAQLLTIPYSHFCEFGAWSLEAAKVPFDELAYGPGGNVLPLMRLRLGDGEKHVASTSAVAKPSR